MSVSLDAARELERLDFARADNRLIQNLPLARLHICHGKLRAETISTPNSTLHTWRGSPLRGHPYVMHRGRFTDTFRDACRRFSSGRCMTLQ